MVVLGYVLRVVLIRPNTMAKESDLTPLIWLILGMALLGITDHLTDQVEAKVEKAEILPIQPVKLWGNVR